MNLLNALCFLPDGTLDRRDVEIEGGTLRLHSPGTLKEGTDASRMLCLPGMVNAHFHGLSTPGKGLEHDHPLTEWFGEIPETAMQARVYDVIEQDLLEEEMEAIALFEYMQLLKQGVTRVFDGGAVNGSIPAQKRALERLGMRGVLDADSLLPDFAGHPALLHNLVTQGSGDGVKGVCIAGNWVVWDGVCTQVDEKAAAGHWRDVMEKIREKAGAC